MREKPKFEDLVWERIKLQEGTSCTCNACERVGFSVKWWRAVVWLTDTVNFQILACSKRCIRNMRGFPDIQRGAIDQPWEKVSEWIQLKEKGVI